MRAFKSAMLIPRWVARSVMNFNCLLLALPAWDRRSKLPARARDMALKRFGVEPVPAKGKSLKKAALAGESDLGVEKAAPSKGLRQGAADLPNPPGYAKKVEIAGKEASEIECVRWVMRNLYIRDVTIDDAPDGVAWTMLNIIRSTPGAPMEFLKGAYAKTIPNRSQIETENPQDTDGSSIEELCVELRVLSRKLENDDPEEDE